MIRLGAAAIVSLALAGCAAQSVNESEPTSSSWTAKLPSIPFVTPKGSKSPVIADLKPGAYQVSSLAIGEEKDVAQQRGQGLGFVRLAPVEQYLGELRAKLVTASGVTGVPGRVTILANPAFAALSTPDGNLYVSMGCLKSLASADEVAAILAHELSHVLLTHHSADLIATMQRKGQALHEIGANAQAAFSGSRKVAKSETRALANQQLALEVTDKLALPAWGRRQEREADLLGVDLLSRAGFSPPAMVNMLEKLQAWENQNKEAEDSFWDRLGQTAQKNPGEALSLAYQQVVDVVATSHPKTDERIRETAEYLDRHYADAKPVEAQTAPWKALTERPDVAQVRQNYESAFSAKKMLESGKTPDAYASAKSAVTGRTATDAYPNWVLFLAARATGRPNEATAALRRAISATEPVPQIYEELILNYERAGQITTALEWTEKASTVFGKAPRWTPPKIRLLRKAGRTSEATALALSCAVDTPDWKRACQEANQTPAGQPPR